MVFPLRAQNATAELEELFQEAEHYEKIALFGQSLSTLDKLLKLADEVDNDEYRIKAVILESEIFRSTGRYIRALEALQDVKGIRKYPNLYVKKLGRVAAIHREYGATPEAVKNDTVLKILNEGIALAKKYELTEDEASLRNELGLMQAQQSKFEQADANLERAAHLFRSLGDTENEMWVARNIMTSLIWQTRFEEFNELYPEVIRAIDTAEWYQLKSEIYTLIGNVERAHGDKEKGWEWHGKAQSAVSEYYIQANSSQMAAFTTLYDTEKFKKEALEKQAELDRQKYQLNQYIFFSVILLLIVALVLIVLVRERRLKRDLNKNVADLNVMNDKYEMLIVESNHRIKNNLQMIISMLEFSKKGIEHSKTDIIQSISGKIQTISTLHKHLYLDMHNEFVDLEFYFTELIEQYRQMDMEQTIQMEIDEVQIRSERIVYFGLILNEMLTNTIEHSRDAENPVTIKVKAKDGHWHFEYCDYSRHESSREAGTGLQLIKGLVGRVGGKEYLLDKNNGTYQFQFETKHSKSVVTS